MYSKVKIAGHAVHPMLIVFPVAFYTATFVCYLVYQSTLNLFWFRVGYVANVAGVVMAIVAAIPGFIDWAFGIPNQVPAKRTGVIHMILNVLALILFAICAWAGAGQYNNDQPVAGGITFLAAIGFLLTLGAGYFGWTLVQVHHVGVDLTPSQEQLEPTIRDVFPTDQPHRQTT